MVWRCQRLLEGNFNLKQIKCIHNMRKVWRSNVLKKLLDSSKPRTQATLGGDLHCENKYGHKGGKEYRIGSQRGGGGVHPEDGSACPQAYLVEGPEGVKWNGISLIWNGIGCENSVKMWKII